MQNISRTGNTRSPSSLPSGRSYPGLSQQHSRVSGVFSARATPLFAEASVTTAVAGADNDLAYTARPYGPSGNTVRVRYVVSGTSTPLSVTVSGSDITVNVATDGGGLATSTASQVAAAIQATPAASALVTVTNAPTNNGSGVVAAMSYISLAGGA